MDDLGLAVEAIANVVVEFFYKKAFDKSKKLYVRLIYILLYILINLSMISLLTYIAIKIIKSNLFVAIIILIFDILFVFMLIYPFLKKKKK